MSGVHVQGNRCGSKAAVGAGTGDAKAFLASAMIPTAKAAVKRMVFFKRVISGIAE